MNKYINILLLLFAIEVVIKQISPTYRIVCRDPKGENRIVWQKLKPDYGVTEELFCGLNWKDVREMSWDDYKILYADKETIKEFEPKKKG